MSQAVARNSTHHPFLNALKKNTADMLKDLKEKLEAVNADREALESRKD